MADAVGLTIDRLATERARRVLPSIFAEHGVPGEQQGELFHFGFAGLVGRVEVMGDSEETNVHVHLTLSAPVLAAPVLDCWVGMGNGPAAALEDALRQWARGAYFAYHDALAHAQAPSYHLERAGVRWDVFEAPLMLRGGGKEQLEQVVASAPTLSLLARPELQLSPFRAHRVRWIGGAVAQEVLVDDQEHFDLRDVLRTFSWPEPTPNLIRHSAVLLPAALSAARGAHNVSLEDADDMLQQASGLVDAEKRATVLSALQHGLELEPAHPRAPDLCRRWSELELQLRYQWPTSPLDVPASRGLLVAYRLMGQGYLQTAIEYLKDNAGRTSLLSDTLPAHVRSLAALYAERALPARTEALIHSAKHAINTNSSIRSSAVSSLEAPSAVAVLQQVCRGIQVSFSEIPEPDPRLAQGEGAVVLWTYESSSELGTAARPAVPAPAADVAARIAGLAATPYSRSSWGHGAETLAKELGDARIPDLLAVMVHPPDLAGVPPWESRFAVMAAATFVLGRLVKGAESTAMKTLLGLLDGPVDWTTSVAMLALVDVALRDSRAEHFVLMELLDRMKRPMSPIWFMCFMEPLFWLGLRLPSLPESLVGAFTRQLLAD